MKILECFIDSFGVLKDCKFSFSGGANTFVWKNGEGKTTLSVFIKAMLYGLDDTRRAKLSENDRKHYLPWSGEVCRGSLTVQVGKRVYRIERSFGQKASEDSFKLYDSESGLLSCDYSEKIGEELFGIDADGFERTLFLSEQNLSGKNENKSIAARLSSLTGSEADIGALDEAIERLEEDRRFYRKRGGAGEIEDVREKISAYQLRLSEIERKKEEYALYKSKEGELLKSLASLREKKRELDVHNERLGKEEIRASFEKSYRERLYAIRELETKKEALGKFFVRRMPTGSEIEDIVIKNSELDRMNRTLAVSLGAGLPESTDTLSEIRSLSALSKDLQREELYVKEKRAQAEKARESARQIFPEAAPTKEELDACLKKTRLGNIRKAITLTSAILILTVGILLYRVNPALSLCALLSIPAFLLSLKKSKGSVWDILKKYPCSINTRGKDEKIILSLKAALSEYSSLTKTAAKMDTEANGVLFECEAKKRRIESFLFAHGQKNALSLDSGLYELELEFAKREAMRGVYQKEFSDLKSRASALQNEISSFVSLFPVNNGERAIDQIKLNFYEYERLCEQIARASAELSRFAENHGIDTHRVSSTDFEPKSYEKRDTGSLVSEISELERQQTLTLRTMDELMRDIEAEDEIRASVNELMRREKEAVKSLTAIEQAKKFLKAASDALSKKYLHKTKAAFSSYVSLIEKEENGCVDIDTSFSVKRREGSVTKPSDAYSKGTRDLYALAVRFALIDALYDKEEPFVILDDPFAYFDDERLSRALALIKAMGKNRQIIYLTATKTRSV